MDSDVKANNDRVMRSAQPGGRKKPKLPVTYADLADTQQVCESLRSRLRQAVANRQPHERDWKRILLAWFLRPSTVKEDSWESDRHLPIIFKNIETAAPILANAVIDPKRPFAVVGLTPDGKGVAKSQEILLNHQALTVSKWLVAAEDFVWWLSAIGTAYLDHYWSYSVETRRVPKVVTDPVTGKKVKRMIDAELTTSDNPVAECPNPLSIWADPAARPGDELEWYFQMVRTTIGELREIAGKGHIDEKALEAFITDYVPNEQPADAATSSFEFEGALVWQEFLKEVNHSQGRSEPRSDDKLDTEKEIIVLKYVSKSETITMGDPTHIIGYSENTNLRRRTGLVLCHLYKVMDDAVGRGIGHVLLGHQELSNENINIWGDTARLELFAPVVVDKNKVAVGEDDFIWEPNKLIRARGGKEAIERLDVHAPTDLVLKIDTHLARDADDATGFSAQARGAQPAASTSATAFQGVGNNMTARLKLLVSRIGQALSQSGQLLLDLDMQFMDKTTIAMLTGQEDIEYREIQPQEIVGESLVRACVSTARLSKDTVGQRMLQLTQTIVPLLAQGLQKDPAIATYLRALLENLDIENADVIFPKAGPVSLDPLVENALMGAGVVLHAKPADQHMQHLQAHQQLAAEWQAKQEAGEQVPPAWVAVLTNHQLEHEQLIAQQAQAQMAAQPGAAASDGGGGVAPPAAAGMRAKPGSPQGVAQATGGTGSPGVGAPGPVAAAGRPMGG